MTSERRDDERRGVALLLLATLFFSLMSVQVKILGQSLPVEMMILARAAVTLVLSWVHLRRAKISPWGNRRGLLLVRGLLGVGGLVGFFTALTRLPLAEATLIHYLNPILTALLAAWLLKEGIDRRLVVALILGFAGTWFVAAPGGTLTLDGVGVAFALASAVFSAFAYVCVRKLTLTESSHVIVFYFPLVALPITLPLAIAVWVWPTPGQWALLIGLGVATQVGQVFLTRGLAKVPVGRGMAVGYVQLVLASLWGVTLFGEQPAWTTGVGALFVAAGVIVLVSRRRLPASHATHASKPFAP